VEDEDHLPHHHLNLHHAFSKVRAAHHHHHHKTSASSSSLSLKAPVDSQNIAGGKLSEDQR
jgi:hypothetical protein